MEDANRSSWALNDSSNLAHKLSIIDHQQDDSRSNEINEIEKTFKLLAEEILEPNQHRKSMCN